MQYRIGHVKDIGLEHLKEGGDAHLCFQQTECFLLPGSLLDSEDKVINLKNT